MVVRKRFEVVMFYYFQGKRKVVIFNCFCVLSEKTKVFKIEKLKKHRT